MKGECLLFISFTVSPCARMATSSNDLSSSRSAVHMFGSRTMGGGEVRHTRLDVAGSLAGRSYEAAGRGVVNRGWRFRSKCVRAKPKTDKHYGSQITKKSSCHCRDCQFCQRSGGSGT